MCTYRLRAVSKYVDHELELIPVGNTAGEFVCVQPIKKLYVYMFNQFIVLVCNFLVLYLFSFVHFQFLAGYVSVYLFACVCVCVCLCVGLCV